MIFRKINRSEIHLIQEISKITWPVAFGKILSEEQLAFMMEMMYSESALKKQFSEGQQFYVCFEKNKAIGFIGFELNYKGFPQLKIHKLYILPNQQGKGLGQQFIQLAEKIAKQENQEKLTLNVNRYNSAHDFYIKLNFENVKSEDIEIGNNYLMEDFVMEKTVAK